MTSRPLLYFGINSVGMGHATRSRAIIEDLGAIYDVHVFGSGRLLAMLSPHVACAHEIPPPVLLYRDNRMLVRESLWAGIKRIPSAVLRGLRIMREIFRRRPVAVLTDYEPVTAWSAMLTGTPVVSLDNQHLVTWGIYGGGPDDEDAVSARRTMLRANAWIAPRKDRTLISSFFQPPLAAKAARCGVRYVATAVRPEVRERVGRTRADGPVLVYQTSDTNTDLLATLERAHDASGLAFVVYGAARPVGTIAPAVRCKTFSETEFLDDMAAAPFVIVNGGHSTITEALCLGKPVLAEPIRAQYEQATNSIGLQQLGVGRRTNRLTVDDIVSFRNELASMTQAIGALRPADNRALVRSVLQALWEVNPRAAVDPTRCFDERVK